MNIATTGKSIFFFLILLICISTHLSSEILIQNSKEGKDWLIEINNQSDELYEAMIISADPSYHPETGELSVEPDQTAILRLKCSDIEETSHDTVYIRLISDHKENPGLIPLGTIENRDEKETALITEGVLLEYFYTPTCSSCREFLNIEIPRLEKKLNVTISLKNIDITTSNGLILMNQKLSEMGSSEKKLPIVVIEKEILAGDRNIEKNLEEIILKISSGLYEPETKGPGRQNLSLSLLPILLAGLLDGINPCAFSTLIFLLSWLTLAGRNRKEILITGIFFTVAVFGTYYTVGLGAFTTLRSSKMVPMVSSILKYSMASVLLVLGIIHIFDYRKVLQNRAGEMTLQLSRERKKKIHSLIRGKARNSGLFAGSVILGVLVTIYELGCTGQVYLPTLMYMVRIEKVLSSFLLLAVYNLGFIIPLIIVFIAAWRGIGSEKLGTWFGKNLAAVKLLSAAFFLMMALLLVIL